MISKKGNDMETHDRTNCFKNNYKTADNHPDLKGKLTLSKDLMRALVEDLKAGREAVLDIAMWKRLQKDGSTPYLSMSVQRALSEEELAAKGYVKKDDAFGGVTDEGFATKKDAAADVPF